MESAVAGVTRPCALARIAANPDPETMPDVAALFFDNLVTKIPWPVLPVDRDSSLRLLAGSVSPREVYAALDAEEQVIGVAFVTADDRVLCLDESALRGVWGRWGAFWRETAVMLARLGTRRSHALRIEGLAVRADCREAGVGSAMLKRIIGDARAAGFSRVALDVGDDNVVARRLYERFGFRVTRSVWAPRIARTRLRPLVMMSLDL